jgi:DNA modification methylase
MIALYSKPGDLVVDPFAGGGTTLKVAVEMDRRAIGYEIVDQYAKTADSVAETTLKTRAAKKRL